MAIPIGNNRIVLTLTELSFNTTEKPVLLLKQYVVLFDWTALVIWMSPGYLNVVILYFTCDWECCQRNRCSFETNNIAELAPTIFVQKPVPELVTCAWGQAEDRVQHSEIQLCIINWISDYFKEYVLSLSLIPLYIVAENR